MMASDFTGLRVCRPMFKHSQESSLGCQLLIDLISVDWLFDLAVC